MARIVFIFFLCPGFFMVPIQPCLRSHRARFRRHAVGWWLRPVRYCKLETLHVGESDRYVSGGLGGEALEETFAIYATRWQGAHHARALLARQVDPHRASCYRKIHTIGFRDASLIDDMITQVGKKGLVMREVIDALASSREFHTK